MVLKKKWSKWGSKSYAQEEATWRKRKCNEKEAYYLWMEEGRAHNMWGKLCSSNGKPTKRKTPSAKYVVNVKEKKKNRKREREYIQRLNDLTRPMLKSFWERAGKHQNGDQTKGTRGKI